MKAGARSRGAETPELDDQEEPVALGRMTFAFLCNCERQLAWCQRFPGRQLRSSDVRV